RETGDCQALISERMRFLVSMVSVCAVDSKAGMAVGTRCSSAEWVQQLAAMRRRAEPTSGA
ncbi:MAG TPA: hypothetical protein DCX47_12630, partial [Pseudomonas sp.]|nr:hypothetical protein [Pseudomonas sp.]